MQTAEQLDKEADELWKQAYLPEESEVEAKPDTEKEVKGEAEGEAKADPETKPEAKAEPKPEEKPEAAPDDSQDELEGLTVSNAEERIKNAQARMTRATQEAAELRKKVEPLEASNAELKEGNAKLQGELQTIKQQLDQVQSAAPSKKTDTAKTEDAELQTAMEDYPEVVGPLSRQNELLAQQNQELSKRIDQLEGKVTTTTEEMEAEKRQAAQELHMATIRAVHSDVDKIAKSQDFDGWMSRQPAAVQQIVQKGTADDVIWVLNQYKEAVGLSDKLEAARDATTSATPRARNQPIQGKPRFTRAMIDAMSPEEFQKNEAAIDEALSRGEIY